MLSNKEAVERLDQAITGATEMAFTLNGIREPHEGNYEVEIALGHLARLRKRLESLRQRKSIDLMIEEDFGPRAPN